MAKESGYIGKLGMFITIGVAFFIIGIYFIGKQQNLFGKTFQLQAKFKTVGGLKVGNNVRFSGINVGTVEGIELITDSTVVVKLVLQEEVRQFIKTDAMASIGSDGLMGDKVLSIAPGEKSTIMVADHASIGSISAIEIDDIMRSLKSSVDNAGIITGQLAKFSFKMNNENGTLAKLLTDASFANSLQNTLLNLERGSSEFSKFTVKMNNKKGVLSKLVNDEKLGNSIDSTIYNIQSSTKGLNENMEAAKHNFLLKGYFNKKKKEAAKKAKQKEKEKN